MVLPIETCFIGIGVHRSGIDSGEVDYVIRHDRTAEFCKSPARKKELLSTIDALKKQIEDCYPAAGGDGANSDQSAGRPV